MITDPVGDFLTRIRNAQQRLKKEVEVPSTKMLVSISEILKNENFIKDYEVVDEKPQNKLVLKLRYADETPAIRGLKRISKPGIRKYRGYKDIQKIKSGMGIAIFSTPKGVITGAKAQEMKVGGEYICEIF